MIDTKGEKLTFAASETNAGNARNAEGHCRAQVGEASRDFDLATRTPASDPPETFSISRLSWVSKIR
ncbi:hypothetical protein [Tranquillimonas rosea]|uniref:hypothetical protein n=1 Tax=Tranquillimonas rosea TaxID=641238 RepID=UPI001160DA02|nr:hypothetical protein [Tranquillimonas rosea]